MSERQWTEAVTEVLEPFARLAEAYESFDGHHDYPDEEVAFGIIGPFKITVGDLRAARSLLNQLRGESTERQRKGGA